jgi:integrase
MEKYLEENVKGKRCERSYRGYAKNLQAFFGDLLISEISPAKINDFRLKRKCQVKPGTINRDLSLLKACFNVAIRQWEWVDSNTVTKILMEKEPPGRVRFLSNEEFDTLHSNCREWLKPIILTARHSGLRKENVLSLKWNQVDLFRRVIKGSSKN